ncbi:MAG: DMT family transporter [Rhodospirillaceae bacterium]|jgi:drug/metabolite transporter (DMT)-like permease|nr:DMT family transporter [Rhodospirillales bacterium]MBT3905436.1 DMT family transporter [Rhodospirillaceae bacterium]MBT4703505.1 DMT family transporter [Rhodospirillaceae bacterium]MBT5034634.1 DMT family transporter [Rhodospirillaceae bacterium]MBT6220478.1 DMT family transporter [Rhodospirillaceae bacterium]
MTTEAQTARSNALGIIFMLAGGLCITVQDAITKLLTEIYPVGETVGYRGLFTFIPIALLVWREGNIDCLRIVNMKGQITRAVIAVSTMVLIVSSFRVLPFADVIIILFTGPIFATALATPLLGEKVGMRRWAAVGVGFIGVLVMLRPDGFQIQTLLLLPVAASLLTSLRDITTRSLHKTETTISILFWSIVAVTIAGFSTYFYEWKPLQLEHVHMFIAAGVLNGLAHFCMITAFQHAEVSLVSPFKYANIIYAVVLGYFIWGEVPSSHMVMGAALVIIAGLYIMRREARVRG